MIPYLLAVAGGYLIGDATKDKKLFSGGGMTNRDDILSEVIDDEIRVYEDVLRDICRGVGEGIEDLDVISPSAKVDIYNEIYISFIYNAWGGIAIEEWKYLQNKINKYVGKGELRRFSINPTTHSVTLTFTSLLPMGLYDTKTFAKGGSVNEEFIELESVGTVVDSKTLMTYPILSDGSYDFYEFSAVPLKMAFEEGSNWYNSLSKKDFDKVKSLLNS
jgi:hypothetical protein